MTTQPQYDLVIKGGRVLDPESGTDGQMDVAVNGGRIAALSPNIDASSARRVVEVAGKLVTPGLIDIHTHVAASIRKAGREDMMTTPDIAGVFAGITTVVDAGSTGALNIGGFVRHVAATASTRTLAFVNVGTLGVTRAPEVRSSDDIDIDASVEAIRSHPEVIKGVKLRMVSPGVTELGIDLPVSAKKISSEAGVPMMVHMGDILGDAMEAGQLAPRLLSEVLQAGDIVTHTLSHHVGALLAGDDLLPQAKDAKARGVIFDVGVGRANFTFESAKKVLDQGLMPDTVSSDITQMSRHAGPTHSLTECMGKMLALGFTVEDVVRMATSEAARAIRMDGDIGSLAVGRDADISILEVVDGDWVFKDAIGGEGRSSKAIVPLAAVRAGDVMPLDFGPRPWGWLPESG
jgi:dihydroorotase